MKRKFERVEVVNLNGDEVAYATADDGTLWRGKVEWIGQDMANHHLHDCWWERLPDLPEVEEES